MFHAIAATPSYGDDRMIIQDVGQMDVAKTIIIDGTITIKDRSDEKRTVASSKKGKTKDVKAEIMPDMPQFRPDVGITPVQEPGELGEVMRHMDSDEIEPHTGMSSMDMKARLDRGEIEGISMIDYFVSIRFYSQNALRLTRVLKRLTVSEGGEGRKEKVAIVQGQREHKNGPMGMGDRFRTLFGMQPKGV